MDILDQLGALVMYWGRGCDAGATLPAVDEASALTREATSAEIIGEPLADIERAAFLAGFRQAREHLERFGSAPRGRSEVNASAIRAAL